MPRKPPAARPGRHVAVAKDGLLSHKNVTGAQKKIFDLNHAESPLLRLPAEIRVRIFEFAVGGHHINIRAKFTNDRDADDRPVTVVGISYNDSGASYANRWGLTSPYYNWSQFKFPSSMGFHFLGENIKITSLARVCRQTYLETDLFLYKLNAFSFWDGSSFELWVKSLKLVQCRAVRTVCVPENYWHLKTYEKMLSGVTTFCYRWTQTGNIMAVHGDRFLKLAAKSGDTRYLQQMIKDFDEEDKAVVLAQTKTG